MKPDSKTYLVRLLVAAVFLSLSFEGISAGPRDNRANDTAPLVALLAPQDGAAINAGTLHVQAVLAAFKPHSKKSFVFNGKTVAGRNAGRISRVEIALDGVVVEQIEIGDCRRQVVVDSPLDIGGLTDGPHSLTVTAFEGHHRAGIARRVRTTFTLDRT